MDLILMAIFSLLGSVVKFIIYSSPIILTRFLEKIFTSLDSSNVQDQLILEGVLLFFQQWITVQTWSDMELLPTCLYPLHIDILDFCEAIVAKVFNPKILWIKQAVATKRLSLE